MRLSHSSPLIWSSYFNPRTPCGVRRPRPDGCADGGAISIHAPRVGCDWTISSWWAVLTEISIHAPRVGCDDKGDFRRVFKNLFQSTHPVWGATAPAAPWASPPAISIHAPRVGCDRGRGRGVGLPQDFNPRTPCGVRPTSGCRPRSGANFNPRTPCGVRPER